MDANEQRDIITKAVHDAFKEAMEHELRTFYIDRETHYKQHEWLGGMIEYTKTCKSWTVKTIIATVIGSIMWLLWVGFSFVSKPNIKP
jgi:hypothetical protein